MKNICRNVLLSSPKRCAHFGKTTLEVIRPRKISPRTCSCSTARSLRTPWNRACSAWSRGMNCCSSRAKCCAKPRNVTDSARSLQHNPSLLFSTSTRNNRTSESCNDCVANFQKITSLNFNKGDLWMLVCVFTWAIYSTLLKKHKFKFSQFTLIQLMVSFGIIFLIPQFFYEKSIGLEVNFNKAFFVILFYVVIFPALAAYYCWQKGVEIVGPNRATMFIQLMPLFSAVMAIIIFNEKFEIYHFGGAAFILTGIYLSNRKSYD